MASRTGQSNIDYTTRGLLMLILGVLVYAISDSNSQYYELVILFSGAFILGGIIGLIFGAVKR